MAIQDHNLQLSEQEYRDLEIPSYSMLSAIQSQGVDVIKGVKTSFNFKFGSLVDVMCFEPHRVNDLFYKGGSVKSPTTSHKKVVDEILESISVPIGAIQNVSTGPFKRKLARKISNKLEDYRSLIVNTAAKHGVLKSYSEDKLVDTIVKSSGLYFKDKLTSRGKTLIKPEMWALALETANTLQAHPFTGKYFAKGVKGVEIIYQYKFDTKVNGRRVKGMLDCLIVNHNKKIIIPVDLKTGEVPCKDFPMIYTSHKYYIQGALYSEALKSIIDSDFELTTIRLN